MLRTHRLALKYFIPFLRMKMPIFYALSFGLDFHSPIFPHQYLNSWFIWISWSLDSSFWDPDIPSDYCSVFLYSKLKMSWLFIQIVAVFKSYLLFHLLYYLLSVIHAINYLGNNSVALFFFLFISDQCLFHYFVMISY